MDELTDIQVEALLYGEISIELAGVCINSWYDREEACKNIDLMWSTPCREVSFVANGMSPAELKKRLEDELTVCFGENRRE